MPDSVSHFFMSFIVKLEHKSSWKALYSVTISFIFTIVKTIHKAVSTYFWQEYICVQQCNMWTCHFSFLLCVCARVCSSTRQHVLFIHAEASDQWALIDFNELIKDREAGGHIVGGYMSMCACVYVSDALQEYRLCDLTRWRAQTYVCRCTQKCPCVCVCVLVSYPVTDGLNWAR